MSTLPPAARQLIAQVAEDGKKFSAKAVGDADGIGVHRAVEFDATTSKWLAPVLDVVDDPRIENVDYNGKGRLTVTFVPDTRSDFTTPFPINEVRAVLDE